MSKLAPSPHRVRDANYPVERFAGDLRLPERFLTDCGIHTQSVDGEVVSAIPYRNAAGDVVCTEHRRSLHDGSIDDWKGGPYLYGLGLSSPALKAGRFTLVERIEDVLVAHLNGIPAVAFTSFDWWPPKWTPLLIHLPEIYAFFDLEKNASLVRELAMSELGDRTFVRDCRGDEQLLERHQCAPTSVRWYWEKYHAEATPLSSAAYWRLGREWYQP